MNKYPSLLARTQSTLIDLIFLFILMVVISNILDQFENVPDWIRITLFSLLFIAYEPVCTTTGSTIGNYIKGIRVRKYADETMKVNFAQALFRYPIKLALGGISYFTIHSNEERRAIHDLIVGSVMIKI